MAPKAGYPSRAHLSVKGGAATRCNSHAHPRSSGARLLRRCHRHQPLAVARLAVQDARTNGRVPCAPPVVLGELMKRRASQEFIAAFVVFGMLSVGLKKRSWRWKMGAAGNTKTGSLGNQSVDWQPHVFLPNKPTRWWYEQREGELGESSTRCQTCLADERVR